MSELVITIHGRPAPQGSKMRTRFGLVDDNAKTLRPWRRLVHAAALAARHTTLTGPVEVEATFTLPRPAGHYGTGRNALTLRRLAPHWPIARGTGDLDKYVRAALDALTTSGVLGDDVQVVELVARKTYPGDAFDALDSPGAVIRVRPLVDTNLGHAA